MTSKYEGLPEPGTRVRVSFVGKSREGIVESIAHVTGGPKARVWMYTKDWDGVTDVLFATMLYAADEMEILPAA